MPAAEGDNSTVRSGKLGEVLTEQTEQTEQTALRTADPAADPQPDHDTEPLPPPPKKPEPRLCGVCGAQPGKYKCPRCLMPYCSVACNKQHKENHPPDLPKPPPPPADPKTEQADPDPYSILLEHRSAFEHLFTRYPNLAAELSRIQETTLPPSESADFQSRATFSLPGRGGAQGRGDRQQPWTREVGLRRGADALRKARTDPSDTGDGVREFCELVRYLLNQRREGVPKVREEVAAEEAKVIERLLQEEGD